MINAIFLLASVMLIGAIIGSFGGSLESEIFGRKKAICIDTLFQVLAAKKHRCNFF